MSQTTSPNGTHRRHSPVRDASTPQMRAVRKELLLLRAEVERAEFVQARAELHRKFAHMSWIKLLVPGFGLGRGRGKSAGRGGGATLTDWIFSHPLASSLASAVLAKPLRATLAAGVKPILKWGALGAAAWAGLSAWSKYSRKRREETEGDANEEE
ncbi:MAG TPA: hypothetical protein VF446_02240 [Trinickia sp.]